MKKFLVLFLCLCMLLSFASCSKNSESGVPDGMMIASAGGADFYLYVPSTWNLNTDYGISGAYRTLSPVSNISAYKQDVSLKLRAEMEVAGVGEGAERLDYFFQNEYRPTVEQIALTGSFTMEENSPAGFVLGGVNARSYRFTAQINGETLSYRVVIAERSDAFYVVAFVATLDLAEQLSASVDSILEVFAFANEPYYPENYKKKIDTSVKAPDGMKIASGKDVAYRFFVPETWAVDLEESVYGAKVADGSNVSVIPYMPENTGMTVTEIYTATKKAVTDLLGEEAFTLLDADDTVSLGGVSAIAYHYTVVIGEETYEYLQVIAPYRGMFYSLTYTALPEHYQTHLSDVESIRTAFIFR